MMTPKDGDFVAIIPNGDGGYNWTAFDSVGAATRFALDNAYGGGSFVARVIEPPIEPTLRFYRIEYIDRLKEASSSELVRAASAEDAMTIFKLNHREAGYWGASKDMQLRIEATHIEAVS